MSSKPVWQSFFEYLTQKKEVPPPTNQEMLNAQTPFSSRTEPPKSP